MQTRTVLKFSEKMAVFKAFSAEPGPVEFVGWDAALRWVKQKTGLTLTKSNLVSIQKSEPGAFVVKSLPGRDFSNQYRKTKDRFDELERLISSLAKRVTDLEKLVLELSTDNVIPSGGFDG